VAIAIPLLVFWLRSIHRHYEAVAVALSTQDLQPIDLIGIGDVAIVPIADIHRGTLRALKYSKRLASDVRAVSIVTSAEQEARVRRRWASFPDVTDGIRLEIIAYDFRDILSPLIEYIEQIAEREYASSLITVVIPEFVPESITAHLLHNQTANLLRMRLLGQENIVIIDIPYHIQDPGCAGPAAGVGDAALRRAFGGGASHVPGTAQELSPDGGNRALCRGRCLPQP
jgi:hypothetical protein